MTQPTIAITQDAPTTAGRKFHILYADDMRELRRLLEVMLGRDGHTIETVADGQQAYEKIRANPLAFDLVITDHHMPLMNGLSLVRLLRALSYPGKIVVFTSELGEEVTEAYRRLGVDAILPKPIFPRTLRSVLAAL